LVWPGLLLNFEKVNGWVKLKARISSKLQAVHIWTTRNEQDLHWKRRTSKQESRVPPLLFRDSELSTRRDWRTLYRSSEQKRTFRVLKTGTAWHEL